MNDNFEVYESEFQLDLYQKALSLNPEEKEYNLDSTRGSFSSPNISELLRAVPFVDPNLIIPLENSSIEKLKNSNSLLESDPLVANTSVVNAEAIIKEDLTNSGSQTVKPKVLFRNSESENVLNEKSLNADELEKNLSAKKLESKEIEALEQDINSLESKEEINPFWKERKKDGGEEEENENEDNAEIFQSFIAVTPGDRLLINNYLETARQSEPGSNIYSKNGDFSTALNDLRSFFADPTGRPIEEIRPGRLFIVRLDEQVTVVARNFSTQGFPTIEIQDKSSGSSIALAKVRYKIPALAWF